MKYNGNMNGTLRYAEGIVVRIVDVAVVGVVVALLALRLVLRALGANPGAEFVAWLYGVTDQLLAPFAGMFPALAVGGYVIELSTIFALIAYAVIGWVVMKLISLIIGTVLRIEN